MSRSALSKAQLARLLLIALAMSACGGDDPSSPGADAGADAEGPLPLEVAGGYGSGTYAAGSTVHIWADLAPTSELLTGWTGDSGLLERPAEWHTTITMPARPAAVEAVVEPRSEELAVAAFLGATAHEKTIRYYAPPSPVGLLLLLHGTGGSSRIIDKPEGRYLALAAIARGYAVLAPEAEEVAQGDLNGDGKIRWDVSATPDNVDAANLDELIAWLRTQGIIAPSAPIYVVGMSNGGAASVGFGALAETAAAAAFPNLRFAAAVSYCASGRATAAAATTTPTAWFLCANDDNPEVSNAEAEANSAALSARGIPTELDAHPASPLYAERLARVPGVAVATSAAIADELRAAGFVGPDSVLTVPTNDIEAAALADPSAFPVLTSLSGEQLAAVRDQIKVMQAEHTFYSDWAMRTVDFLDGHQP